MPETTPQFSPTSSELAPGINESHPAVGEFTAGLPKAEQVRALGHAVSTKVESMAAMPSASLTDAERNLVRTAGSMGARTLSYLITRGAKLPPFQDVNGRMTKYGAHAFEVMRTIPSEGISHEEAVKFGIDPDVTSKMLDRVTETGLPLDADTLPRQREAVDSLAVNALPAAAEILAYNEIAGTGFSLDPSDKYLAGNLNNIAAQQVVAEGRPFPQ